MSDVTLTVITTLISTILSSSVVGAIVTHVIKKIEEKDSCKKYSKEADKLLLLDLLKRTAAQHKENGFISQQDFAIFEATHKCYKNCGGDGWADGVLSEMKALPKVL